LDLVAQGAIAFVTAICFQTRHKLKYKTRCGALPCDPLCGGVVKKILLKKKKKL